MSKRAREEDEPAASSDATPAITSMVASSERQMGVIAWFDPTTGWGSLLRVDSAPAPDASADPSPKPDTTVFFHISSVVYASLTLASSDGTPTTPPPLQPGEIVSFLVFTAPDTGELWAQDIRGPTGDGLKTTTVEASPAVDDGPRPPRFPETSWDVDPGSLLSNSWTKEDGKRAPDPCGVIWHTESWTGLKPTQEDRAANGRTRVKGVTYRYFGVFDGHGGPHCSEFLRKKIHTGLLNHIRQAPRPKRTPKDDLAAFTSLQSSLITNSVMDTFKRLDADFLELSKRSSFEDGSTALVVCVTGNSADALLLSVANLGDCRAVLCCGGKASRLSNDHKPNTGEERARITDAGGAVINVMGVWRVGPSITLGDGAKRTWLSVSRSFGDISLKEPSAIVSAVPDILHRTISDTDCFIVTACDGIWDVLSDQQVVDLVLSAGCASPDVFDVKAAATAVVRSAHQNKSADNLTCTVIGFPWQLELMKTLAATLTSVSDPTPPAAISSDAATELATEEVDDMFA